jgi:hypothetical protein
MVKEGVAMNELLTTLQDIAAPGTLAKQSALRATTIKIGYLKSMIHMHHATTTERPDNPAMRWGRLVHQAILEPHKSPAIWTGAQRRGKDYEAWLSNLPDGIEIVTMAEYSEVQKCRDSVLSNRRVVELLDGAKCEYKFRHDDSELGLCVATMDAWKEGCLTDLKTTGQINALSFTRTSAQMAYHVQFGWYSWMLEQSKIDRLPKCYAVAIEAKPPYDCAVYQISAMDVMSGAQEAVKIARAYRECERAGVFPGQQKEDDAIDVLQFPEGRIRRKQFQKTKAI